MLTSSLQCLLKLHSVEIHNRAEFVCFIIQYEINYTGGVEEPVDNMIRVIDINHNLNVKVHNLV